MRKRLPAALLALGVLIPGQLLVVLPPVTARAATAPFHQFVTVASYTGTPTGVAFDPQGNRFVVFQNGPRDHGPTQVLEYLATNPQAATNFANDGGNSSGVAYDTALNKLLEVQPTNIAGNTVFSEDLSGVTAISAINNATGVVADQNGNIFVATGANGTIVELPITGGNSTLVNDLTNPTALAIKSAGVLVIGNCGTGSNHGKLIQLTVAGAQETILAQNMVCPDGIALSPNGSLVVSDYGTGIVYRQSLSGSFVPIAQGLVRPQGIAFDLAGNLFIANSGAKNIVEMPASAFAAQLSITQRVSSATANSITIRWATPAFTREATCTLFRRQGYRSVLVRAKMVSTAMCSFTRLPKSTTFVVHAVTTDGTVNSPEVLVNIKTKAR